MSDNGINEPALHRKILNIILRYFASLERAFAIVDTNSREFGKATRDILRYLTPDLVEISNGNISNGSQALIENIRGKSPSLLSMNIKILSSNLIYVDKNRIDIDVLTRSTNQEIDRIVYITRDAKFQLKRYSHDNKYRISYLEIVTLDEIIC